MDVFTVRPCRRGQNLLIRLRILFLLMVVSAPPALGGTCKFGKLAELPISMQNLRPEVRAKINGSDVSFVLDSGAFYSTMDGASAARLHLETYPAPAGFHVTGVGGSISVRLTRVKELSLSGIPIPNVEFIVGGNDAGDGNIGLLGRNFLQIADAEYDLARGMARLMVAQGCGRSMLAYWLKPGDTYSVVDLARTSDADALGWRLSKIASPIIGSAYVNGAQMRVMFDTGAETSVLSIKAAARAGIKLDSPGVTSAGFGFGIGRSTVANYLAPVSSFKIGDEEIRNTKLRVVDGELEDADMLIGADFFLSHHVFVANSQRKIYFSYNGGPVFNLKPVLAAAPTAAPSPPPPSSPDGQPAQNPTEPAAPEGLSADKATTPPASTTDTSGNAAEAAEAARRGQALASRRLFDQALTELTRACQAAPGEPEYFYQRGMVYWQSNQPRPALADFDRSIELQPNHIPALLARAELHTENGDPSGAAADLASADASVAREDGVRFALAEAYLRLDLYPQAIEQYTLWIASHPSDVRFPSALHERCRARALAGSDLSLALADCGEALKHAVKSSSFFASTTQSRALVMLRLGRYDKSIADFDAALKIDAKDAFSLYGRGVAENRANKLSAAEADMTKARDLSPKIADKFTKFGLLP